MKLAYASHKAGAAHKHGSLRIPPIADRDALTHEAYSPHMIEAQPQAFNELDFAKLNEWMFSSQKHRLF